MRVSSANGKELWHYDLGDERTSRVTPFNPAIDPSFDFTLFLGVSGGTPYQMRHKG